MNRLIHFRLQQRHSVLLIVLLLFVAACTVSRNPMSGQKRLYAYTWSQEQQIGREADQQIQTYYGVYDDAQLDQYVSRIGEEVLQHSHMRRPDTPEEFRDTPFEFRVLDSPVVNAFALPGGFIYVTRGLLSHLDNEAQLAVVLGHEIVHVAARHASQRQLAAQLGQVGLIGGAILAQEVLGLPAQDVLQIGGTAAQLLFLRYGRDDERESDQNGVEYAAMAGYQAGEASEFFVSLRRIGEQHGHGLPTFLSSHPDPGEREQTINRLADQFAERFEMTTINQEQFYNAIDGMVLGENPRQGFVRNNAFLHPDLRFQYPVPSGWQVQNEASQVVMIDGDQRAAIILQIIPDAQSAAAAAGELARQQGLNVVDQGSTQVNGLPAQVIIADASQNGQHYRLQVYFIEYGGRVYRFLGYTARDLFATYRPAFNQTMEGFAQLRDQSILNIQPTRVGIVPASRTAAFREFLPQTLPPGMSAEDLAIMNQVELDETIQQGTPLKLPRN